MSTLPFPRANWLYITFVAIAGTGTLASIGWLITSQVYGDWSQGQPIRGGWNWPVVIAVDAVFILLILSLYWKIYCDVRTEIGDRGISRPSLRGVRSISWNQVTDIKVFNGVGYHVFAGRQGKIMISPYAYAEPETVIQTILEQSRIARSAA